MCIIGAHCAGMFAEGFVNLHRWMSEPPLWPRHQGVGGGSLPAAASPHHFLGALPAQCFLKVLYSCQASVWHMAHCEWMLTECHRGFISAEGRKRLEDGVTRRLYPSRCCILPGWWDSSDLHSSSPDHLMVLVTIDDFV